MRLGMIWIFAGAFGMASCSTTGDNAERTPDASGVYVREYAFEITNPETGRKVGLRQVRDSIFIEPAEKGYQVSNRKWRMNDYDQEGWVSMSHAGDRPFPTFFARYDEGLSALTSQNSSHIQPILIEKDRVLKDKKIAYQKVE